MIVTYRDELGLISLEIESGAGFDGTEAYFTDIDGIDYKIEAQNLISILQKEW